MLFLMRRAPASIRCLAFSPPQKNHTWNCPPCFAFAGLILIKNFKWRETIFISESGANGLRAANADEREADEERIWGLCWKCDADNWAVVSASVGGTRGGRGGARLPPLSVWSSTYTGMCFRTHLLRRVMAHWYVPPCEPFHWLCIEITHRL